MRLTFSQVQAVGVDKREDLGGPPFLHSHHAGDANGGTVDHLHVPFIGLRQAVEDPVQTPIFRHRPKRL